MLIYEFYTNQLITNKAVMPIYESYANQPARNALIIISEY